MKKKMALALLALGAFGVVSTTNTKPVQAVTNLGKPNLTEYCRRNYPIRGTQVVFGLTRNDAHSLHCRIPFPSQRSTWDIRIDMNLACRQQYNNVHAYARAMNNRDIYSWQCFRP